METYDNRPIGVFDSGLGGLTAVTYMTELLPYENFVYFGDTARTPYGSKSIETIRNFSAQISDFLVEKGAKIIVIACNTVSATCLDFLRKRHPRIPIIGMIGPAAREVSELYDKTHNIGVIGTKVTIESGQYEEAIRKFNGKCNAKSKACPLFVPTIEEGIEEPYILEPIIKYYLDDFIKNNRIDTLVLGCTHYPLIEGEIKRIYPKLEIVNPSKTVAEEVKRYLFNNNMLSLEKDDKSLFFASDLSEKFMDMTKVILSGKSMSIKEKKFGCIHNTEFQKEEALDI